MKVIKSLMDFSNLRECLVEQRIVDFLENEFRLLHRRLAQGIPIESFSLEDFGYLVLLEPSDNTKDLSELGLPPGSAGLMDVNPEFVIKYPLPDGHQLYRVGVLFNNEWMLELFCLAGQFDTEVETWLQEQSITF